MPTKYPSLRKMNHIKKKYADNFLNIAYQIADILCPIKYSHNAKYDNKYFMICIIDFLECATYWRRYKGTLEYPIDGRYLNKIHNKYVKAGVYVELERQCRNRYLALDKESKMKIQITDTSFIQNHQGSVKSNNHLLSDKEKIANEKIRKFNETVADEDKKRERTFIDNNRYNG